MGQICSVKGESSSLVLHGGSPWLGKRVEKRGRQGSGSEDCTQVHAADLVRHLPYLQHCLSTLRRDLFPYHSDPNYTLIRRERKSVEHIILTTWLLWKLPSFSFQRHEIISVFSVTLISPTLLALFSHVGLALKNLTWHLVSSQLKRYQFLDLMSAVPRSKPRNIKVDIYYLFHGLHQWCFSLPFFVIIADVLPIMLCSLLKSVCPLQTNIHINVIHQQLTNASSLRHFLHTQDSHCFCRNICRIRPLGGDFGASDSLPQPKQCPGSAGGAAQLAGTGSGRWCIPSLHCECCRGEKNARLWGEQKLK